MCISTEHVVPVEEESSMRGEYLVYLEEEAGGKLELGLAPNQGITSVNKDALG